MSDFTHTDKGTIRTQIRAQRLKMQGDTRALWSAKIVDTVSGLSSFQHADVICSFVSMPDEVQVTALTALAHEQGISVMLPAFDAAAKRYQLREWLPAAPLEIGNWNIPEPVGTDFHVPTGNICVIVPGLAFDLKGNRIGYGLGFYDRILEDLRRPRTNAVTAIGVAYAFQIFETLPHHDHDERVDFVVTEHEYISIHKEAT
jgi:5-formyltetrahydrofolate cyclo-ligase